MVMWVMSDRAVPRSLRFMEGFGVHTFRLVDAAGKSTFVKFHWKPKLGMQSVVWNEAVKLNGADPDFHRRDLWNAIGAGRFPEWELGVQLFDDAFAAKFEFDILDPTKLIPEEQLPVRIVGRMVLDRRVDNAFAETEQVAFCTQNVVPGIDFSNDPLLQGRNFSYLDTQLKRLGGPNFTHLPINAPKCPVMHFQQDGHMAMRNPKGRANYEPNSWGDQGGPRETPAGYKSVPESFPPDAAKVRQRPETFSDHYSQARQFYVSQTPVEQAHIADALVFELSKVQTVAIRARMVSHLLNIDAGLADKVAKGLRLEPVPAPMQAAKPTRQDLPPSPKLSILKNPPATFAGRKVGALVTDGVDAGVLAALRKALEAEGAGLALVAPQVGGVTDSAGTLHPADEQVGGPVGAVRRGGGAGVAGGAERWRSCRRAQGDFVADAAAHFKYVGYSAAAAALFEKAGVALDEGFVRLDDAGTAAGFVTTSAATVLDRGAKKCGRARNRKRQRNHWHERLWPRWSAKASGKRNYPRERLRLRVAPREAASGEAETSFTTRYSHAPRPPVRPGRPRAGRPVRRPRPRRRRDRSRAGAVLPHVRGRRPRGVRVPRSGRLSARGGRPLGRRARRAARVSQRPPVRRLPGRPPRHRADRVRTRPHGERRAPVAWRPWTWP